MLKRCLYFVLAIFLATSASAQGKKRIEKAADMPRFTYKVEGKLEDLVRDEKAFARFAAEVRRDTQSVLDGYDIADKAAQRGLIGVLAQIDFLEGRYADAGKRADEMRALEEKPADKLISGMQLRAMVAAQAKTGGIGSDAYRNEVGRIIAAELAKLPYPVIENDIKGAKSSAEVIGEALVMGNVRDRLQPVVDKAGGVLSSDFAPAIIGARYALVARLPLKQTLVATFGAYLAANKVEKSDIWAARDVALPEGRPLAPVNIAIWDSGVDTALFRDRLVLDAAGKPAYIAFDRYANPTTGELVPIPAELQGKLPAMKSRTKGLSDLRSNIDSKEASEVKALLSTLKPEEYRSVIEELSLAGNYSHGTHVAGIAMAGNPYARLANARIDFNYKLLPDPCPSPELAERGVRNTQAYVDFLKKNGVRVVNMSWGGSVRGYEAALELCNIGKTPDDRKALAREYFDKQKAALTAAFASAPEILFVTSAGNANQDSTFAEAVPAGIVLPNLLTVGAVDKAGDEAPFTSYGPTVKLHANGYQVESYLPGGDRVALSGTSMSAPQVTNLAAKLLAVNPKLTPVQLVALMQETAEKSADGRRILIHPGKALAAAQGKKRIEKATDIPTFTYKVEGKLEDLVRNEAAFKRFAAEVRRDNQSVLDGYEIADKSAHRDLLAVQAQIDFLEGRYAEAARRAEEIRALEEKPADKLISGLAIRTMVAAQAKVGNVTSDAYRQEVGRLMAAELAKHPYPVISNDIKQYKSSAEIIGESLIMGGIRDRLQPVVDKAGGVLSSDFAPAIVRTRFALLARLPLKQTLIDTYSAYLAANKVDKPDIWAARDIELPKGQKYSPVRIAVWDSGVDAPIFKDRLVRDGRGKPLFLAFDVHENPSKSELMPIPPELRSRIPAMKSRMKGFSDLQSNVESPEATEVKTVLSQLKREEYKGVIEELGLAGNYSHGTHVAGIAMAGNPYARLVNARLEFGYKLLPDPCPSRELAEKNVKNSKAFVDFFRKNGVRVVNMSWGGTAKSIENELELCNIGKSPEERKKIAREYFDMQKKGLTDAFASAPEILFVTAAGNSNADATFEEDIPANIVLPNLLTVGAVDKAGDEAPFTSYGPTVKAHANGYQVDSYLPGGERVAFSGTSMASPQVAGLAAKMLAVNPKLKPAEVIAVIEKTSEKTADGRRILIHPARALAAVKAG